MSTRVFATRIVAKNINSRRSSVVGVGAVVIAVAAVVAVVVAVVVAIAVVVLIRLTARWGRRSSPTGGACGACISSNFTAPLKGVHGSGKASYSCRNHRHFVVVLRL